MRGTETTTEVVQAEAATVAEVADKVSVAVVVEEVAAVANGAVVVVAVGTGVLMPMWDKVTEEGAWSTRRMSMAHLRRDRVGATTR
jgi:hypothetical protein